LLVSTGAVSCYPSSMVESGSLITDVYRDSTEQHVDMKSGVSRSKNATTLQARCASALSCSNMWKSNYPHRQINAIALHVFFVAATVYL